MPSRASSASERGCTCPVGLLPALIAFHPAGVRWLKMPSARIERQELPVQRNRTFISCAPMELREERENDLAALRRSAQISTLLLQDGRSNILRSGKTQSGRASMECSPPVALEAALLLYRHKARMSQRLQMERKICRRHVQDRRDFTCHDAIRSFFSRAAYTHLAARLMRGTQRWRVRYSCPRFNYTITIEVTS